MIAVVLVCSTCITLYNLMMIVQYCCLYSLYRMLGLHSLFITHCNFVPLKSIIPTAPMPRLLVTTILLTVFYKLTFLDFTHVMLHSRCLCRTYLS